MKTEMEYRVRMEYRGFNCSGRRPGGFTNQTFNSIEECERHIKSCKETWEKHVNEPWHDNKEIPTKYWIEGRKVTEWEKLK